MFSVLDIVMFVIGAILLIMWMLFFFVGKKNEAFFEYLKEENYPLKEIYFVGYAILNTINYQYKSKSDRKLRKELSILFDDKYADYYVRVTYAQKVTLCFTILQLAVPVYALADDVLAAVVVVMFAFVAYYYYGTNVSERIKKRSEALLSDFSNVVSKLALLTNAGMIIREAWEEVAYTGESVFYLEMQKAVDEMNNGYSETDALYNFGMRCIIPEIKKFTSTIIQGIEKGNSELTHMLEEQSGETWNLKKQDVRRQGEKAASKLMIPMMMMFIGILIMVVIPIFANIGV